MTKLLGANWRTTITGIGSAVFGLLTILAALPYTLGDISTIFPPSWKPKIVAISAIATAVLKVWNSLLQKDRTVTGGIVGQDANGNVSNVPAVPPAIPASNPQQP